MVVASSLRGHPADTQLFPEQRSSGLDQRGPVEVLPKRGVLPQGKALVLLL